MGRRLSYTTGKQKSNIGFGTAFERLGQNVGQTSGQNMCFHGVSQSSKE